MKRFALSLLIAASLLVTVDSAQAGPLGVFPGLDGHRAKAVLKRVVRPFGGRFALRGSCS